MMCASATAIGQFTDLNFLTRYSIKLDVNVIDIYCNSNVMLL